MKDNLDVTFLSTTVIIFSDAVSDPVLVQLERVAVGERRVCLFSHAGSKVEHKGPALRDAKETGALEYERVDWRRIVAWGMYAPPLCGTADIPECNDAMTGSSGRHET